MHLHLKQLNLQINLQKIKTINEIIRKHNSITKALEQRKRGVNY